MKKSFLSVLLCLTATLSCFGQAELQKVVPLTPNAAAIAKYGETPVGHFTGTANVSIPVFTVSGKGLNLPLSLSYHGGGIKVEEVASWVGLGWSIGSIPTISRNVRGLPDEGTGGFFSEYNGLTVKEIQDQNKLNDASWLQNYNIALYEGNADNEADIFSFSLAGRSGKFFWDQSAQRFRTTPRSNVRITYSPSNNNFTIVDEDGTVYIFAYQEKSTSSGYSAGNPVTTSWLASKMYNANHRDSITFGYQYEQQLTTTLNTVVKTYLSNCPVNQTYTNINSMDAYTISTIHFNDGYVQFTRDTNGRQDLNGGHALSKIEVFNLSQQLVKAMNFSYSYWESQSNYPFCMSNGDYEKKRMMLDSAWESGSGGMLGPKYRFAYDTSIAAPCRVSPAQDLYGFYNGEVGNADLVPTTTVNGILGPGNVTIQGADRSVSPAHNQFGILKRMYYPTGGYTDFEYETHQAFNVELGSELITRMASLSGEPNPTTNTYIDTFTVNHASGSSLANISIGSLGCDPSNAGSPACALLTLKGLDSGNSQINMNVYSNLSYVLPNGNYEMKAVFNQTPVQYESFYYMVTWQEPDSGVLSGNKYVGGLRIKTIKTYDGTGKRIMRSYQYTKALDSLESSGNIFGAAHNSGWEVVQCVASGSVEAALRISAHPNLQIVSHSGSFTGYQKVYEKIDSLGASGLNEYQFTNMRDGILASVPFPPPVSNEEFRGQLLEQTVYQKVGNSYWPVKRITNEYLDVELDTAAVTSLKSKLWELPQMNVNNVYVNGPSHHFEFYQITPKWSGLSKTTEKTFNSTDTTQFMAVVTNYTYNSNFQLSTIKFLNSKGQEVKSVSYYPHELTLTGTAESARQALLNRNMVNTVLKQEKLVAGNVTEEVKTNYALFGGNNQVLPQEIFLKKGSGPSESRVKFLSFDADGNLLEQQKTGDVVASYVYDYNGNYPVAEVTGANVSEVAYTSFEADGPGNWQGITSSYISPAYGITGSKCYQYSGFSLSRAGLPAKTYLVSYWSRNGSYSVNGSTPTAGVTLRGWTYYQHKITNPVNGTITVSGSGAIDELRLHPANAFMTTYAYKPLAGVATVCDASGRLTYYDYDVLGRLRLVRDKDLNVLKKICYNYYNQPEDCTENVTQQWQQTGLTRCKPCAANPDYNSNILQKLESDVNPLSPGYGSTRWTDIGVDNACGNLAAWQNTQSPLVCQTSFGQNTGNQMQEQVDVNPCSPTYNQTQWVVSGNNTTACPQTPCTSSSCAGADKKCINGICETACRENLSTSHVAHPVTGQLVWRCVYRYVWSDSSYSQNYTEYNTTQCGLVILCPSE
jgi:hypothetical protein